MGYTIPLKFIRISENMSICATRILCILDMNTAQARRILREEKDGNTLLKATGPRAAASLVIMDNGIVITSPFTMGRILANIASASSKKPYKKDISLGQSLRIYDVYPDEVMDGTADTTPDIDAIGINSEMPKRESVDMQKVDTMPENGDPDLIAEALDVYWDGGDAQ